MEQAAPVPVPSAAHEQANNNEIPGVAANVLVLNGEPSHYFNDFVYFCDALRQNNEISSARVTSQFLLSLRQADRIALMRVIGSLPALEVLAVGAVRPACVLTETLKCASNLRTLKFWKLKLSSNEDVVELSHAIAQCQALQTISFSDIRFAVEGQNRVNHQGKIYFQETDASRREVSLDPLYNALRTLPQLRILEVRQPLNESRIQPPSEKSLRSLCQSPRKSLAFNDCGLSDQQCFILADELKSNALPLSRLGVAENYQISSKAWDKFVDMLEVNYNIKEFDYGEEEQVNTPNADQLAKISHYLRLNQHGRRKLLCGNHGSRRAAWIDFLIRGRDNLDLVFFAMQADPSLYSDVNAIFVQTLI